MALPKWIEDKKAIINMKCDGCFSFKYAVTSALYPVEKRTGIVSKVLEEQSEGLDWSSVVVPDFERNNGIGINLIGLSGGKIVALKVAGWTYWRVITLFFYEDRYYVVKNIIVVYGRAKLTGVGGRGYFAIGVCYLLEVRLGLIDILLPVVLRKIYRSVLV